MTKAFKKGDTEAVAQALEQAVIDNTPNRIQTLLTYVTQPLLALSSIQQGQTDYFLDRELRKTASSVLSKMSSLSDAPDPLKNMKRQFCLYLAHLALHHSQKALASTLIKGEKLEQDCQNIDPLKNLMIQAHEKAVIEQTQLFNANKALLRKRASMRAIPLKRRPSGNNLT